jgi:predicted ATPase
MWKSMLFTMRIKGTFAEAKATLDSSLGMIERFNEHLWEAENHRVRGEVALDAGQFPEALTAFDQAIKVARDQSALSLELRAANSCAKLLATRGDRGKAHDLLAPIYNRFTECFGTHDVKRAKALLAELRARRPISKRPPRYELRLLTFDNLGTFAA